MEKNVVRFEKKATNKIALILVIILAIGIFAGGGYLLYKNRDLFDWDAKLPWKDKEDKKDKDDKKDDDDDDYIPTEDEVQYTPSFTSPYYLTNIVLAFEKVRMTEKGYLVELKSGVSNPDHEVTVEKILIDNFAIKDTFKIPNVDLKYKDYEQFPKTKFYITRAELDNYGMRSFEIMNIYIRVKNRRTKEEEISRLEFRMTNRIAVNNKRKGLISLGKPKDMVTNFYKVKTDKDYTYLYFDFFNEDQSHFRKVRINKLIVNNKIYEVKKFELNFYRGEEKIFYIKIPKKDIPEIKNFTVSFFILTQEENGNTLRIDITKDFKKELK